MFKAIVSVTVVGLLLGSCVSTPTASIVSSEVIDNVAMCAGGVISRDQLSTIYRKKKSENLTEKEILVSLNKSVEGIFFNQANASQETKRHNFEVYSACIANTATEAYLELYRLNIVQGVNQQVSALKIQAQNNVKLETKDLEKIIPWLNKEFNIGHSAKVAVISKKGGANEKITLMIDGKTSTAGSAQNKTFASVVREIIGGEKFATVSLLDLTPEQRKRAEEAAQVEAKEKWKQVRHNLYYNLSIPGYKPVSAVIDKRYAFNQEFILQPEPTRLVVSELQGDRDGVTQMIRSILTKQNVSVIYKKNVDAEIEVLKKLLPEGFSIARQAELDARIRDFPNLIIKGKVRNHGRKQ